MQNSILFAFIGGVVHFTYFFLVRDAEAGPMTSLLGPTILSALVIYFGIRAMRKRNHGWLNIREGFFTGMNISTGSGAVLGLLIWFYYTEMNPQEAMEMANQAGIEEPIFKENMDRIVLSFAFPPFLFTFISGLPFAALFGWLLRSKPKRS